MWRVVWREQQHPQLGGGAGPSGGGGGSGSGSGSSGSGSGSGGFDGEAWTKAVTRKWGLEEAKTAATEHQKQWERFRASPPECVTYDCVPWIPDAPEGCPAQDLLLLVMGLDAVVKVRERKRQQMEGATLRC